MQESAASEEERIYNEKVLEYLVDSCIRLAGLQKTLRHFPHFREEEMKVLKVCSAIRSEILPHCNERQKEKLNYMFYG